MMIGARTIKTALAVSLSMYLCNVLNLQPSLFAGAATVLNLQPSVGLSIKNAREQLLNHLFSIIMAILLGLLLGGHPISMGLSTILVIVVSNRFRWQTVSSGVMAALFILASPSGDFLAQAKIRAAVIFIGVGVALVVNATIAPPRYGATLRKKLLELNVANTEAFSEAISSFLNLALLSPDIKLQRKNAIKKLTSQAQNLLNLYRHERNPNPENEESENYQEMSFYSDYIHYNKGLRQRTRDILFLAEERFHRREQAGNQPISPQFEDILTLLKSALDFFIQQNTVLQQKLEGQTVIPAQDPHIWNKLDYILTNWHDHFPSGSYHLHALVEVTLITYKIRWGVKEVNLMLANDSSDNEPESQPQA